MRLPHINLAFDYVLILEWLDKDDRRTGEELHEFLQQLNVPTCMVKCNSADHVRAALQRALENVSVRGIPVVHIESHGSDPFDQADVRDADFGINAVPGLPWTELGDWLAPLNVASTFRLLVVGATCYGFAAIAAMKTGEHPAPFAATVGFSTSVGESSLHDAMKEFYRSVCQRREKLQDAVTAAEQELRDSSEKIRVTTSPVLAIRILRGVYDTIRPGEPLTTHAEALVAKLRDSGLPVPRQVRDAMPTVLQASGNARLEEAWNSWFPATSQEDQAYRLDWEWIEREKLDS